MEKIEDIKTNENENSVTNQEKRREYDISHIDKEHNTSKIISKHELDRKKSKYLPINFGPINKNNYNQLKQLNNMTLPVRYMDGFYFRIMHGLRYGRFAYYNDLIVGAISWKYDNCKGEKNIYLMTISVLDEYRRYGIGSKLLEEMIKIHEKTKELTYITLHVQTSNEVALRFYEKHKFERVKLLENYYTGNKINPKDAYYLRYKIHKTELN